MGLLIHDGYTSDGKVEAAGRWPELNFRYRVALPEAVFEYRRACRAGGKEELAAAVSLLKGQLVSWDATLLADGKEEGAPVSPENIRRLPAPVLDRLVDLVCGYGPAQAAADAKN